MKQKTEKKNELLFVFIAWIYRGNPCRDGNGRRYGDDTAFDPCRGRGTKDCAIGEFVFLFPDELIRAENARGQRAFENAGNPLDGVTCAANLCNRRAVCGFVAVRAFAKGVWGVFDWARARWILSVKTE